MEDAIHIGNILGSVLESARRESGGGFLKIWQVWDDVVGEGISENAKPAAFKEDILLVHAVSSAWIHHLQFLKKDIIQRLNEAAGSELVQEIKFKIGPV